MNNIMAFCFKTEKHNLNSFVVQMQKIARQYVSLYYPAADIEIRIEPCSFNIMSIDSFLTLSIIIHYYDAELISRNGIRIFNTSTLLYSATAENEVISFRFMYGNINDAQTFFPTHDVNNSFELGLIRYLYKKLEHLIFY